MTKNQLSNGGPDGNTFGQSTTDKISFYDATPVAQQTTSSFTSTLAATTTTTATTTALQADVDALRTRINKLVAALNTYALTAAA